MTALSSCRYLLSSGESGLRHFLVYVAQNKHAINDVYFYLNQRFKVFIRLILYIRFVMVAINYHISIYTLRKASIVMNALLSSFRPAISIRTLFYISVSRGVNYWACV